MKIAIIPARGGSKRIPGKNIKDFAGRPLISLSITAAIQTGLFDEVIVSTDSEAIAEVAVQAGATVPFVRPPELADDFALTAPVLRHAVEWLLANGREIEYFCCIYANPFVTSKNLLRAFQLLKDKNATGVMPVATFESPVYRGMKITQPEGLEYIFPEFAATRSQDLPEVYHDAGQFYWWNCQKFLVANHPTLEGRIPCIIPRYLVQDLDTMEDWKTAELLYSALFKGNTDFNP